ncbi:hypothetical protein [Photorhabdus bodei]|uniref:hypothetical protein n=1 Tax=Photorhabdus bodei TaxID=2029681 RepID=UPI001EFDF14F|nr:hypothetical protein [Photorhabdus bodei]
MYKNSAMIYSGQIHKSDDASDMAQDLIDKTLLNYQPDYIYTLWISRCIAAARERIPGSIDNYVTGVSECSQQRGNLKDDGYMPLWE